MDIGGRNILVLGGAGMVGVSVCRQLLGRRPARLVVAARRQARAEQATARLNKEFPGTDTEIVGVWGDVFLRSQWQAETVGRREILADKDRRAEVLSDIYGPLNDQMVGASLLANFVCGRTAALRDIPADIVIDCMNTASALGYQDVYSTAGRALLELSTGGTEGICDDTAGQLLASLSIPQLVRHVQLLLEAMRRSGTRAYVKVGTSGTGGMGLNIPYTHGEERPSRMLLSKAALAGAQSLLTFLMARTPNGPAIVKEVKPSALIGWRDIGFGPVSHGGKAIAIYDCAIENALAADDMANLAANGEFGVAMGEKLTGVYIDTGENGVFSAAEFSTITALGQMEMVTPEEIADSVVREIEGGNSGHDIVAALDGSIMGPTYRGGALRDVALAKLHALEEAHGEAVAFEILGPPRLSKLLFEAHILRLQSDNMETLMKAQPEELAGAAQNLIENNADIRRHIISIGLAILLVDGKRLLRGPTIKAGDADHGWVDLTRANMERWQERFKKINDLTKTERSGDFSSRFDRVQLQSRSWGGGCKFEIGEVAAWIFTHEDMGSRDKR
ncbi:MAG: short-chain dehydrogenase [Rhodospirillales bacterium]|nr:short-chain dehydrogenase [Rhodospirillales bacterium]